MVKNDYYELDYDSVKNQVFWKIKGFWQSVDVVPNYNKDWDFVINQTSTDFTIFADLTEMRPFPSDVAQMNEKKQKELIKSGCRKAAQYNKSTATVDQVNKIAQESGMDSILRAFENEEEAKRWLDEK